MTDNPDAFLIGPDAFDAHRDGVRGDRLNIAEPRFDGSRYHYQNSTQRWRDTATGRFVSSDSVTSQMRRHVAATFDTLEGLTDQLYDGSITVQQWQAAVASELKDAHLAQSMFARGGKLNMTSVEYGRVGGVLRDEYRYLSRFADGIAAGRQSRAQALARIRQYGKATQQAYWREYAQATRDDDWLYWELGVAEHCPDCLALAGGSPYRPNELSTYPGAGDTRCRGNCNCTLRRGPR